MEKFNVTYEMFNEESIENCDSYERDFVVRGVGLREAVEQVLDTRTIHCDRSVIEADEWPVRAPRSISVVNNADWIDGISETRVLHIPEHVTDSSRRRIARLFRLRVVS
mgnify:CR=1 FL=1